MSIELRKALPEEGAKIREVIEYTRGLIYPKYYTSDVVNYFKSRQTEDRLPADIAQGKVILLLKDGQIIGAGSFDGNQITRVYVLPEHQGQGLGAEILQALEDEIFPHYDWCELNTSAPAALFYENRGYRTLKHVRYVMDNGGFMIYEIMRKDRPVKPEEPEEPAAESAEAEGI